MKRIFTLAISMSIAATVALAQTPGPGGQGQGQGQGGPGGGRFGGQRGMMMGRGAGNLIMREDVQKELNLTDQQKAQLKEKLPQMQRGQRGQGGPGGRAAGGGQGGSAAGAPAGQGGQGAATGAPGQGQGGRQNFQEMQAKNEAIIKEILTDVQYKRYQELQLQFAGPAGLSNPETAKKVGLTEEQRNKIATIQQTQMQNMRERMRDAQGGGDRETMMQEMQKMREETNKQILAVLTEEQKTKWNELQGKPFKFQQMGRAGG